MTASGSSGTARRSLHGDRPSPAVTPSRRLRSGRRQHARRDGMSSRGCRNASPTSRPAGAARRGPRTRRSASGRAAGRSAEPWPSPTHYDRSCTPLDLAGVQVVKSISAPLAQWDRGQGRSLRIPWKEGRSKVSMPVRAGVAIALLAIAATALSLVAGSAQTSSVVRDRGEFQGGAGALQRHQELFGTSKGESPASYADELAALNAFPDATISPSEIAGAQAAHQKNEEHGTGHGKRKAGQWVSLGPTKSVYPASLNRHGSEYVTSGRITALAMSPTCDRRQCTVWVGAAGGGVWKSDKALTGDPGWQNVSDGFFTSGAIGSLTFDAAHNTLYAGTGEDAAAGDAEAGVGVYKSTDGGSTWTPLGGNANFVNRAIRQVEIDHNDPSGNTIYVADGRGVHGISSTTAGPVSGIPGGPGVGVWKSTDGGNTFTLLQPTVVTGAGTLFPSSFGSTRGATAVAVDPTHPGVVYAAAYNVGVWRSTDNGATWTNIHPCSVDPIAPPSPAVPVSGTCGAQADRSEFALVTLPNGDTRMYQTEGDSGPPTIAGVFHGELRYSRLFIANGAQSGSPTFVDKTSAGLITHTDAAGNVTVDPASPGYATYNFCTGQCWYDQGVYSPPGQDRKSTRLNSSHMSISYAVFCLKKKSDQSRLGHLVRNNYEIGARWR